MECYDILMISKRHISSVWELLIQQLRPTFIVDAASAPPAKGPLVTSADLLVSKDLNVLVSADGASKSTSQSG